MRKSVLTNRTTSSSTCWKRTHWFTWLLTSSQRGVTNCCRGKHPKRSPLIKPLWWSETRQWTSPAPRQLSRALAFDLVKACGYHAMNGYHADLFDHLHQPPPPGYSAVSLAQLLRVDRAAWLHIAERLTSLKRDEHGNLPLETEIQQVLAHPSVSFHLLPLPVKTADKPKPDKPKGPTQPRRSRSPARRDTPNPGPKGKGKGKKGTNKKGRGPNIPKGLIGKNLQTSKGDRLCWAYNLPQGCNSARPGEKCDRGLHLCAEPGCEKPHSLQNHQ